MGRMSDVSSHMMLATMPQPQPPPLYSRKVYLCTVVSFQMAQSFELFTGLEPETFTVVSAVALHLQTRVSEGEDFSWEVYLSSTTLGMQNKTLRE